jgi:hypothetical protein
MYYIFSIKILQTKHHFLISDNLEGEWSYCYLSHELFFYISYDSFVFSNLNRFFFIASFYMIKDISENFSNPEKPKKKYVVNNR